eukprot:TRINITY_DN865_c0_g1_i1.p1 TRINITY_DN865_c0_g1~~TRINITY_DN865_c0_g1_i1.p1  ORF type:complete len:187 (+),score=79.09 TRINITY_DN865_c0_g1_i1:40-561(+)
MANVDRPEKTEDEIKAQPNVLFIITRSKNKNVVVYEAKMRADGSFDANPIEVYWMDIDPEYVRSARGRGVMTDRTELGYVEKQMAYGVTATPTGNPNEFQLTLVALKARNVGLKLDQNGRPRATITIDGRPCYLQHIYVNSKDNMIGLPTVQYVDVFGVAVDNGEAVTERIRP